MLLKHRREGVDSTSLYRRPGFEHLDHKSLAVIRWLGAHKIDYVLVGPVAHAVRGDRMARGTVAIVPAPYGRNHDRLARALNAEHAILRSDRGPVDRADSVPVKLTTEKLTRGRRWLLRFGEYELDVEMAAARPDGVRYQELLYEATRFELAEGVSVEVASLEDLEHFSHVRRTGSVPEFRVTRAGGGETSGVDAPSDRAQAPGGDGAEAPGDAGAEASGHSGAQAPGDSAAPADQRAPADGADA